MVPDIHFGSNAELRRYEALLQMADLMVHHQDLEELFRKLEEQPMAIMPIERGKIREYATGTAAARPVYLDDRKPRSRRRSLRPSCSGPPDISR